jgi:DNA-directed RNA polymerase subunit H (RpoH/RPB5)
MDFETVDILFRSRQTLLQILKAKGYQTRPYEKFGPFEVECMCSNSRDANMNMTLEREVEGSAAPAKCYVRYGLPRIKNRLKSFMEKIVYTEEGELAVDPATTEIVVITMEPIGDSFHLEALKQFTVNKLRVSFFDAHTLISNPLEHVLVPKHEIVPKDEEETLLKNLRCLKKTNLPKIRFHEDIIGRLLGLMPSDIVKITRPSPSAGETVYYRVCMP